jgi:hypothetical protein
VLVQLEHDGLDLVFLRLVIGVFGTRRELCGRIRRKVKWDIQFEVFVDFSKVDVSFVFD